MTQWRGIALACALAGCATPQTQAPSASTDQIAQESLAQQQFVISSRIAESRRVEAVYERLSAANLEFCKHTSGSIGAGVQQRSDYPKQFKDAAIAVGVPDATTISYVLDNSPAAKAGLKPGDQIVKLNGQELAAKGAGESQFSKGISEWADRSVTLSISRAGAAMDLTIVPAKLCGYPVVEIDNQTLNASATGKSVLLQRGMLNFIHDDQELALVLGHELRTTRWAISMRRRRTKSPA